MGEIYLTDLIEVEMLQRLQDAFSNMTGMAALTTDAQGKPVTKGSNFTKYCMDLTRTNELGCSRCEECDRLGAMITLETGKAEAYMCHSGLTDFSAPIMMGDKVIGCFIGGQVLTEMPKKNFITAKAKEMGVDPEEYWEALQEVKILEHEKITAAADFLYDTAKVVSDIAYGKYQAIENSKEAERVAAMKSDFLANMSHEIRTPMNAVIGMTELALRMDLPPEAQGYINQIKNSGVALLNIINDILDFSKIESGKMDINESEYEIRSVINDVANTVATTIKNKPIKLNVDINPDLPSYLCGDYLRISQVLLNLANNGVKFTKEGSVTISVDFVKLNKDNIKLKISVKDTGIGISEENLEKLFVSFQQLDSKRNRNVEGTGLGLAISKRLINLMNGDLEVESVVGKGSEFTFWLPQKIVECNWRNDEDKENAGINEDKDGLNFIAPDARILIVDDNETNIQVAEGLLQPLQMKIDTAFSGVDALKMIELENYDLVFMDHMMPELDGVETTRIIRRLHPRLANMPIIALTANAVGGAKAMFLSEGMNDFISKPVEMKRLVSITKKWLPDEKIIKSDIQLEDESIDLPEIGDLDVKAALALIGSPKLFWKILNTYYSNIEKKAALIMDYLMAEDFRNYTIEVHALKSSSKQIGAIELSDAAAALEKAGNEADVEYIINNTQPLVQKYLSYVEVFKPFFPEEEKEPAEKQSFDEKELKKIFFNLHTALDELDMDAMEAAVEKIGQFELEDAAYQYYKDLKETVSNMDTFGAEEILLDWEKLLG